MDDARHIAVGRRNLLHRRDPHDTGRGVPGYDVQRHRQVAGHMREQPGLASVPCDLVRAVALAAEAGVLVQHVGQAVAHAAGTVRAALGQDARRHARRMLQAGMCRPFLVYHLQLPMRVPVPRAHRRRPARPLQAPRSALEPRLQPRPDPQALRGGLRLSGLQVRHHQAT